MLIAAAPGVGDITMIITTAFLGAAVALIIGAVRPLTMTGPAQGASCRSEYDLCRLVLADPVRTKPNPAMIGSCRGRSGLAPGKINLGGSGMLPVTRAGNATARSRRIRGYGDRRDQARETGRFVKRQSPSNPNVWVSLDDLRPAVATAVPP
jgi:hypothetical protein